MVFNGTTTPNVVLLARVDRMILDHNTYTQQVYKSSVPRQASSSNRWFNYDDVEGWIGMGVMARDEKGGVLFMASRRVRAWWAPEIGEGKALIFALKLVLRFGYEHIIVESDIIAKFLYLAFLKLSFSCRNSIVF